MNANPNHCLNLAVGAALVAQSLGCGTLMYPDRSGARGGHVDVGVAVLDGIGLLFFIIPGVAAFAVDFSDGAIYLPDTEPGSLSMRRVRYDRTGGQAAIEAAILSETGRRVDLDSRHVRIVRLNSTAELSDRFTNLQSER
jgi:hypothetical protein